MIEKYITLRTIRSSQNSFSSVYEIQDKDTGKNYALKIIKGITTPLYDVVFEREVGALNKLRTCENIVRIEYYDKYIDSEHGKCGRIFLEFLEGDNLDDVDVIEMSNRQKFHLVNKLVEAVQAAHENNIIHRDINPKNIMVVSDDSVKLIDFGISKIKDMINSDTTYQFATNRYAAPEVHNHNENATEQSDIYSLGAVFYYLFTGNEPPIADDFEEHLKSIGGIDIEFKSIIDKMIRKNLNERYKNIFDVKKTILKIIKRFSKSNKTFVFQVSNSTVSHMKNLSLIPRQVSNSQAIQEHLYEEFLDGFISIEKEDTEQTDYILCGTHCSMECIFDEELELFKVAKVTKIMPHKREEFKKKAMEVDGDIRFVQSGVKSSFNNNFELTISVKDHKETFLSSINVNNEYTKKFSAWHKFLEIMELEYKNKVLKIEYNSYKIENEYIIFEISERCFMNLEEVSHDISFISEEKNKTLKIGDMSSYQKQDDKYFLTVNKGHRKIKLPKNGFIFEDYTKNISLINRERKAINAFNYEEYASTSNLKSIFSGIQLASHFKSPKQLRFFNESLDSAQRRAVEKALNSRDIALIQGPPGTGKTNVIIEIIRQIIELNKQGKVFKQNILLVSQSHAAVDKMLEDLNEVSSDNSKVIRIGKDEHLTEIVKEKYAVDYAQSRWIKDVVSKSNSYVEKRLNSLNIDLDEFHEYYKAQLQYKPEGNGSNNKNKTAILEFEGKYRDLVNSKEFKWLMIQKDWVNRVPGRMDIQQHFIRNSVIISGTCTGVVSNAAIRDMIFDYVIIDEAAKATFPELLISIIRAKKIIMVGDHKQLPPVLDTNLIESNVTVFSENNIDSGTLYEGVFERLFDHLPVENKHVLSTQYRMHPIIGTMISQVFYDNAISNGIASAERGHPIDIYSGLSIVWLDTSQCAERFEESYDTSFGNVFEANLVKEQLKKIDDGIGETKFDVGVITAYSAQKHIILKEIQPINLKRLDAKVAVNTVDAFQGGQKDIIIYSTVRSRRKGRSIGHLKSKERLNVAFSRAKRLLIIIGDAQYLNNESVDGNLFPKIIRYIKDNPNGCEIIDYKQGERM